MKTFSKETEKAVMVIGLLSAMNFYDLIEEGMTAKHWDRQWDRLAKQIDLEMKSPSTLKPWYYR